MEPPRSACGQGWMNADWLKNALEAKVREEENSTKSKLKKKLGHSPHQKQGDEGAQSTPDQPDVATRLPQKEEIRVLKQKIRETEQREADCRELLRAVDLVDLVPSEVKQLTPNQIARGIDARRKLQIESIETEEIMQQHELWQAREALRNCQDRKVPDRNVVEGGLEAMRALHYCEAKILLCESQVDMIRTRDETNYDIAQNEILTLTEQLQRSRDTTAEAQQSLAAKSDEFAAHNHKALHIYEEEMSAMLAQSALEEAQSRHEATDAMRHSADAIRCCEMDCRKGLHDVAELLEEILQAPIPDSHPPPQRQHQQQQDVLYEDLPATPADIQHNPKSGVLGVTMPETNNCLGGNGALRSAPKPFNAIMMSEEMRRCLHAVGQGNFSTVNFKDHVGCTSLIWAVRCHLLQLCLAILSCDSFSEVNATDEYNNTALTWAASMALPDVCRAILRRPDFSALDRRNWWGRCALDYAQHRNLVEIVELIWKRRWMLKWSCCNS
eukprot:gnl/MRDRNA2_/MRDRNA2_76661_c0_seq1.p1 gnl/MRDRNA2_/MRDRNA2_76661_c0~~gnl/MRDRNA2_/MRDRNA2_76661_c0_seq1.p1  ORF type:complete len:499 (-),score=112.42 gnl/MRDRNA2_/MRDRNA2_76661_c0_seq1:55-1551(-)